jgi:hypothetical protein
MSIHTLKPWTELVKLHPDVESGSLAEAVFAIDLGGVATRDPTAPMVYRDPDAFFCATYLTKDLQRMLEEVLASLAGQGNYNRVLKLRTPFGGGKSHTLAALLHAARSRKSLNQIAECRNLADPGPVDVAVFDGEKFTTIGGKEVGHNQTVNTIWGWLAWQIGEAAFKVFEKHDQDRVAPAGDEIKKMLNANGKPVLLLLDEVLKYIEGTAAVAVQESTLQRQVKKFLQDLTVEVANTTHAVMVYSLQWSAREALGNVALLEELDKLTSRKDQVREPVAGDEVLAVVKRRLLADEPEFDAAKEVAKEYSNVVGGMLRSYAETPSAQQDAQEQSVQLRNRMQAAYPFHPALIDVMNSRWTSVDGFQRTRGALRFLAVCLHSLKSKGGARAVLGPAEIPLSDPEVKGAMLKDLDPRQDYSPVLNHDLTGPNARAKRIDDRLAKETPALANVRPALRLATGILAYSFGGLKREGIEGSESLPPGVTESELLAACIGPDLDSITASAVLSELRNTCLYLHYDGVRYCFKKDPNVTKLIEDAEQEIARDPEAVRDQIKEMLGQRLAGRKDAIVWPKISQDFPDREPLFLVGYLPLEFAGKTLSEQEDAANVMLAKHGDGPRRYKNGIGLAIPDKKPIESLRRAVRYLMAVERVDTKKKQHRLTNDQIDQLKERRRTEEAAAETAFRVLYTSVWLPRVGQGGSLEIEKVEVGGRPLQATGVHERIMELLTAVGTPKIHGSLNPRKIVERLKLGEPLAGGEPPRLGVTTSAVQDAFFEFLEPPRISTADVLRKAIVRGVGEGMFAYTTGNPTLGSDNKYEVSLSKVSLGRTMSEDEVDLDSGFLMVPAAVPAPKPVVCPKCGKSPCECVVISPVCPKCGKSPCVCLQPPVLCPKCGKYPCICKGGRTAIRLSFRASRDQVFKSFHPIANLADKSEGGKITIHVEGAAEGQYDSNWLRNAVEEPLDEANVDELKIE